MTAETDSPSEDHGWPAVHVPAGAVALPRRPLLFTGKGVLEDDLPVRKTSDLIGHRLPNLHWPDGPASPESRLPDFVHHAVSERSNHLDPYITTGSERGLADVPPRGVESGYSEVVCVPSDQSVRVASDPGQILVLTGTLSMPAVPSKQPSRSIQDQDFVRLAIRDSDAVAEEDRSGGGL